jgi:hypothetical protein
VAGPGKSRYDHAKIKDVARTMHAELQRVTGSGTLSDVSSRGNVPAAAFGSWDAARSLAATVTAGNQQITSLYQRFLNDFAHVAEMISKIADNYRESDEKMLAAIRSINPSGEQPPTTSTVKPVE